MLLQNKRWKQRTGYTTVPELILEIDFWEFSYVNQNPGSAECKLGARMQGTVMEQKGIHPCSNHIQFFQIYGSHSKMS